MGIIKEIKTITKKMEAMPESQADLKAIAKELEKIKSLATALNEYRKAMRKL